MTLSVNFDRINLVVTSATQKARAESSSSVEKLASGKKINNAADDAAGSAIANRFQTQILGLAQGIQNGMDGASLVNTADHALGTLVTLLQRSRELEVQKLNGTLSAADISAIQNEQNGIRKSLTSIAFETEFNSKPLFRKTQEYPFSVGADTASNITVTLPALVRSTFTYDNASFEADAAGSTEITGWSPITVPVKFGTTQIGGFNTPIDTPAVGTDQNTPSNAGTMTVTVTDEEASDGDNSLRLTSTGITTTSGFDTVRGPAIISDETVGLGFNATVSVDWRSKGGADAYDSYAYLLNVSTGETIEILNSTGASPGEQTDWATAEVKVTKAGTYKFVFVGGTFDATGGRAAGAQLYVDNIRVDPGENPDANYEFILDSGTLSEIESSIETLVTYRADLGATANRIIHAVDYLTSSHINMQRSSSQVMDADYAVETGILATTRLIEEVAMRTLSDWRELRQSLFKQLIASGDSKQS